MNRRWDWVEQMHAALDAAESKPFDYADHNCGLFAASVVDAILVDSHWERDLRAQFVDMVAVDAFLEAEGGIEAAVTKRLGEPTTWVWAQRGDVCMMETQDGPGLGICIGEHVAMISPGGLGQLRVDKALAVWKV